MHISLLLTYQKRKICITCTFNFSWNKPSFLKKIDRVSLNYVSHFAIFIFPMCLKSYGPEVGHKNPHGEKALLVDASCDSKAISAEFFKNTANASHKKSESRIFTFKSKRTSKLFILSFNKKSQLHRWAVLTFFTYTRKNTSIRVFVLRLKNQICSDWNLILGHQRKKNVILLRLEKFVHYAYIVLICRCKEKNVSKKTAEIITSY